jgi:curved DNA-binding protein CbpA
VGQGITWYAVLGVLPGASPAEIQEAYDAKAGVLRPELIAGAPSKVLTAVSRAQGILDAARQVLGDPVSRERYDESAGLRRSGGGLAPPASSPSEPAGGSSEPDFVAGHAGATLLGGLMMLTDWLAPQPRLPGRIPVPDVRGLFYSVCLELVGRLDLQLTAVRLTPRPMPVDGLVVDQSPLPPAKIRREGELTVQVWHPSVQSAGTG